MPQQTSHKFSYFSKSKMATSRHFEFRCNSNRIPMRFQSVSTKYQVIARHPQDAIAVLQHRFHTFQYQRWRIIRHFEFSLMLIEFLFSIRIYSNFKSNLSISCLSRPAINSHIFQNQRWRLPAILNFDAIPIGSRCDSNRFQPNIK